MTITIKPARVNVAMNTEGVSASTGTPIVKEFVERTPYTGEYTVTPSTETQTLETNGLRMTDNITINPIPNNYGLITWNGSVITVS